LQPSFSFAAVVSTTTCSQNCRPGGVSKNEARQQQHDDGSCCVARCFEVHCPKLVALALCWSDKEAALLHLPSQHWLSVKQVEADLTSESTAQSTAAAGVAEAAAASQIWAAVKAVFADSNRTATCFGAAEQLAVLKAAGIHCLLSVHDPCAAFMLWQPQAYDQYVEGQQKQQRITGAQPQQQQQLPDLLRLAQSKVLGDSYRLQVPLLVRPEQTAAVKAALLGRALMPPLRAVLAQQQLSKAFESVERPLQQACADVRSCGVRVEIVKVQQQLRQCQWHREVLHQQMLRLAAGAAAGLDLSKPPDVVKLVSKLCKGPGSRSNEQQPVSASLLRALRSILLGNNQQQWLPLLHCALGFWYLSGYESGIQALLQSADVHHQQHQGGSAGLAAAGSSVVSASGSTMLLQLQPRLGALCGEILPGLPDDLECLLSYAAVPALPVLVASGGVSGLGMKALTAAAHVAVTREAFCGGRSRPEFQFLGTLCSLGTADGTPGSITTSSPASLPWQGLGFGEQQLKHGPGSGQHGCVRSWCSAMSCVNEEEVPSAGLHMVCEQPQDVVLPGLPAAGGQRQQADDAQLETVGAGGKYQLAMLPGHLSLRSAVVPCCSGSVFVGVQLEQLHLLVLAGVSQDEQLLAAFDHVDPVAIVAAHWLKSSGIKQEDALLLLSHVQAGALDGMIVTEAAAPKVLFHAAVDALVLGKKPSVQRGALAVQQGLDLGGSLLQAFPGLRQWQAAVVAGCRETG
jgi:hypothetical protein